jgi:hypothetical protein
MCEKRRSRKTVLFRTQSWFANQLPKFVKIPTASSAQI